MAISDHERAYFLKEAGACARVIVTWHREFGLNLAPSRMVYDGEPRVDSLNDYRQAVSTFLNSDLASIEVQAEVAKTQICGTFEWFYHEIIPASLLARFAEGLQIQQPTHLFEVARHIQQLHERIAESLAPHDESTHPSEDSGRGTPVHFSSRSELQLLARRHYANYIREEHVGIGGVNFLLSSSLERTADRAGDSGEITLLTPEYLGFHVDPISESDDLLSRLKAGEIRIESLEGF